MEALERKEHRKAQMRDYYAMNKEKINNQVKKEYNETRYINNKLSRVLSNIRGRANRGGLPFNLTLSDITPPQTCPILGYPLNIGTVIAQFNSPSVDRIIPSLGYIKGNTQIISYRANRMKNDATPEELVLFAKWVQRTYPEIF